MLIGWHINESWLRVDTPLGNKSSRHDLRDVFEVNAGSNNTSTTE